MFSELSGQSPVLLSSGDPQSSGDCVYHDNRQTERICHVALDRQRSGSYFQECVFEYGSPERNTFGPFQRPILRRVRLNARTFARLNSSGKKTSPSSFFHTTAVKKGKNGNKSVFPFVTRVRSCYIIIFARFFVSPDCGIKPTFSLSFTL